jgi:hypothetical protein
MLEKEVVESSLSNQLAGRVGRIAKGYLMSSFRQFVSDR